MDKKNRPKNRQNKRTKPNTDKKQKHMDRTKHGQKTDRQNKRGQKKTDKTTWTWRQRCMEKGKNR